MIDEKSFKKVSIFVALGVLVVLTVLLLWPLITSIISGLILVYIFYPVYEKILKVVKEKNISAIITIILIALIIFLPLWFLLPILLKQIFDIYLYVQKIDFSLLIKTIFPSLAETEFLKDLAGSISSFISGLVSRTLSSSSKMFLDLPAFALKSVVVFFVLFFGLRDGELFKSYVKSLSPFSKTTEKDLEEKLKNITSSVIKGYIVVGILQGILAGIGLFIFRVPNALILTIAAIITSIIPVLGAWVVWIPAAIYLFVSNQLVSAIGLTLYGGVIVSWIDNILRPYFVARKTKISFAIILIGMIGGLLVFGILGIIIGPLILAYLLLVLDAYRKKRVSSLFFE